jgi:hypothetical protein
MASIYDIQYNQKAIELLPPDKRKPIHVKWVQALIRQMQVLWRKIFILYKQGSVGQIQFWTLFTDYSKGELVIYEQSVYECIKNTPFFGIRPTNLQFWQLYLTYKIGSDERVMYNHTKLVLEYALNRRFASVFRQPPLVSDIYIAKNPPPIEVFVVESDEIGSSVVYKTFSTDFVVNSYAFAEYFSYTIYIPQTTWNQIIPDTFDPFVPANDPIRLNIVKDFVNKYNTIGLFYNIIIY